MRTKLYVNRRYLKNNENEETCELVPASQVKESKPLFPNNFVISFLVAALTLAGIIITAMIRSRDKDPGYDHISPDDAKRCMNADEDITILDVRDRNEYAKGHIPGARCIPVRTIDETIYEQIPDKNATVLVYCITGRRARKAVRRLFLLGYTDVREFGGIKNWPYDIIK